VPLTSSARQIYLSKRTRPAAVGASESGHKRTWHLRFSRRQLFRHFAGVLDEKLRDRAERAVPQGDDAWMARGQS